MLLFVNLFLLLPGRSNKTLYDDVSLIPLPADYQPTVEQLPGTGTDADKGKITRPIMHITWREGQLLTRHLEVLETVKMEALGFIQA